MIIRRKEITKLTGLSWSTIQRMVDAGEFPPVVKLNKRAVGWRRAMLRHGQKSWNIKK